MHPILLVVLVLAAVAVPAVAADAPVNPAIDMNAHLRVSIEAANHRETHRLSEAEFIRKSRERGVVILDARSREKYDELHVKGAVNLSFPDIGIESLARMFPDTNATILIYCNNNFTGNESAFASKVAPASLNLSTYLTLYIYGYRNVWELGPRIDLEKSQLEFESTR